MCFELTEIFLVGKPFSQIFLLSRISFRNIYVITKRGGDAGGYSSFINIHDTCSLFIISLVSSCVARQTEAFHLAVLIKRSELYVSCSRVLVAATHETQLPRSVFSVHSSFLTLNDEVRDAIV